MPDYIAMKKNGIVHLGVSIDNNYLLDTGDELCESNYPFRVFETEFGEAIIVSNSSYIINQLVLSRTDLFPKRKKHIDYDFVSSTYYGKIKKIIADDPLTGTEKQSINILIVSEGKIFEINDDLIREESLCCSYYKLFGACLAIKDNLPEITEKELICDTFQAYSSYQSVNCFPIVYINTSTFVPEIIRGGNL